MNSTHALMPNELAKIPLDRLLANIRAALVDVGLGPFRESIGRHGPERLVALRNVAMVIDGTRGVLNDLNRREASPRLADRIAELADLSKSALAALERLR